VPSYLIQYTTPTDVHAAHFTLDDDAPLEAQVRQVVEELRLQGHILRGGPSDELAVFWQESELDLRQTPRTLGVRSSRPLELRMRPRPVASHQLIGDRYLSRVTYAAVMLAMTAAATAWGLGLLVHDHPALPAPWGAVIADGLFGALVGVCVGATVMGWEAFQAGEPLLAGASRGGLFGALIAALGASGGSALHGALLPGLISVPLRLGTWAITFAALAGLLGRLRRERGHSAPGLAAIIGAVTGALGGLIYNLPGPLTALWQGLALLLCGGAVGYAVTGLRLRGARALVELEAAQRRQVSLLGTRAFVLRDTEQTPLPDVRRGSNTRLAFGASAWFDGSEVILQPLEDARFDAVAVSVAGTTLTEPLRLGDGETIDVGETRYRLHVLRSGAW
jgi:hypothetical protein